MPSLHGTLNKMGKTGQYMIRKLNERETNKVRYKLNETLHKSMTSKEVKKKDIEFILKTITGDSKDIRTNEVKVHHRKNSDSQSRSRSSSDNGDQSAGTLDIESWGSRNVAINVLSEVMGNTNAKNYIKLQKQVDAFLCKNEGIANSIWLSHLKNGTITPFSLRCLDIAMEKASFDGDDDEIINSFKKNIGNNDLKSKDGIKSLIHFARAGEGENPLCFASSDNLSSLRAIAKNALVDIRKDVNLRNLLESSLKSYLNEAKINFKENKAWETLFPLMDQEDEKEYVPDIDSNVNKNELAKEKSITKSDTTINQISSRYDLANIYSNNLQEDLHKNLSVQNNNVNMPKVENEQVKETKSTNQQTIEENGTTLKEEAEGFEKYLDLFEINIAPERENIPWITGLKQGAYDATAVALVKAFTEQDAGVRLVYAEKLIENFRHIKHNLTDLAPIYLKLCKVVNPAPCLAAAFHVQNLDNKKIENKWTSRLDELVAKKNGEFERRDTGRILYSELNEREIESYLKLPEPGFEYDKLPKEWTRELVQEKLDEFAASKDKYLLLDLPTGDGHFAYALFMKRDKMVSGVMRSEISSGLLLKSDPKSTDDRLAGWNSVKTASRSEPVGMTVSQVDREDGRQIAVDLKAFLVKDMEDRIEHIYGDDILEEVNDYLTSMPEDELQKLQQDQRVEAWLYHLHLHG